MKIKLLKTVMSLSVSALAVSPILTSCGPKEEEHTDIIVTPQQVKVSTTSNKATFKFNFSAIPDLFNVAVAIHSDYLKLTSSGATVAQDGTAKVEVQLKQTPTKSTDYRFYLTFTFKNNGKEQIVDTSTLNFSYEYVTPVPTSLKITGPDTIVIGNEAQYSVVVEPQSASPEVEWTVSPKEIAQIDSNGLMMTISSGQATITAKSKVTSLETTKKVIITTQDEFDFYDNVDNSKISYLYSVDKYNNATIGEGWTPSKINVSGKFKSKDCDKATIQYVENGFDCIAYFKNGTEDVGSTKVGHFDNNYFYDHFNDEFWSSESSRFKKEFGIAVDGNSYWYTVKDTKDGFYEYMVLNKEGYITSLVNTWPEGSENKTFADTSISITYENQESDITQEQFLSTYNTYLERYKGYAEAYTDCKMDDGSKYKGSAYTTGTISHDTSTNMEKVTFGSEDPMTIAGETALKSYFNYFNSGYTKTFKKDANTITYRIQSNADSSLYEEVKYDNATFILNWVTTINGLPWSDTDLKNITYGPTYVDFANKYNYFLEHNYPPTIGKYKSIKFDDDSYYMLHKCTKGDVFYENNIAYATLDAIDPYSQTPFEIPLGGRGLDSITQEIVDSFGTLYHYYRVTDEYVGFYLISKEDPNYYMYIKFNKNTYLEYNFANLFGEEIETKLTITAYEE